MFQFWVLFDNKDKPVTRIVVYGSSIESIREKFPNATRILKVE